MAKRSNLSGLRLLGRSEARIPARPSAAILETFPNRTDRPYWIRFQSSDFTSLCPVTRQADFADLTIEYMPGDRCLESKSLKFYLASYRNERAFNEEVTNRILQDLLRAAKPQKMRITARFAARGGLALTVTVSYPDEDVSPR